MSQSRNTSPLGSERGAAMLAALCLAMVFAISLSSYIGLCYVSLGVSTRNVLNTHCAELAEAGVEQALYSINNGVTSGWTLSTVGGTTTMNTTMTMTASGLVQTSTNPTPLNYGNNANGEAIVTIRYPAGTPKNIQTITSQGKMLLPYGILAHGSNVMTLTRTLTVTGGAPSSTSGGEPLFVNAVAGVGGRVSFKSAGTVDSYTSNPSAGVYQNYSASVAAYSAVVLSTDVSSITATVKLNNAVVNGFAVGYDEASPSSTNWLSYSTSGKLQGYSTPVSTYIDSTRILSSPVPYQPVFPENLPNGTGNLPTAACTPSTSNILTNSITLGTTTTPYQVYYASGISLASGDVVQIQGPTVIIVYGSISMSGTATIKLLPGASLAIFAEGGSVNINCTGTNTGIYNSSAVPLAKNFALLSTTNNSSMNTVAFTQATPFYGVIYFPYLKVTVGSTGTAAPIYGSIVGESVTFSNSPVIHYDRALRIPDSTTGDVAFTYITAPSTVSNLVASVP